ncbi:MAG: ArsR/SmtB family transcription factor [Acidimicrobiales bacterium]
MVDHLDDAFGALSDPTRRQVIELLMEGPQMASTLAERTDTSRSAMSRHLRVLRTGGLVQATTPDADARQRLYELRAERFEAAQAWLDQVHAFWSEQLQSFSAHIEATRGNQ